MISPAGHPMELHIWSSVHSYGLTIQPPHEDAQQPFFFLVAIWAWLYSSCGSHKTLTHFVVSHCCTADSEESTVLNSLFVEKRCQSALHRAAFFFSPELVGFLRRVCCPRSCGPPTALLCQQHRRFFWRKWISSHNVVRPATVKPAYAVPKVQ